MKIQKLTIFTFGYWGWGNHTQELLKLIDTAERKAGYAPPVFVDIRFNRAVRAKGFNGDRFQKLVGEKRYFHMKSLGNELIGDANGGIKIKDPSTVTELMDRAIDAHENNRRVIYFCACGCPSGCHRRNVARLLENEGKNRNMAATIVEWPGGDPELHELTVSSEKHAQIVKGRRTIPLLNSNANLRALPWYSVMKILSKESADLPITIFTGPAIMKKGEWHIPVIDVPKVNKMDVMLLAATRLRKKFQYESP